VGGAYDQLIEKKDRETDRHIEWKRGLVHAGWIHRMYRVVEKNIKFSKMLLMEEVFVDRGVHGLVRTTGCPRN
jgi:hypothetical protein